MAARLGNVLYWAGSAIAALLLAFAAWVVLATGNREIGFVVFVSAPAIIAWLLGRACRYVLAGR